MISAARVADKKDWIKGGTGDWEIVIGMEVHAQVLSKSKLFSGASAEFGGAPNDHVSFVDAAMPGMLPVINEFCVAQAVRTGLGLRRRSIIGRFSTGRTISIPICRRAIRYRSTSSRSSVKARSRSTLRADSRSRSESSGFISNRMPASPCTTSIPM